MAITPLHFAFITKYVAHFVAQSLLFPTVVITRFFLNARQGPFSQARSHILYISRALSLRSCIIPSDVLFYSSLFFLTYYVYIYILFLF